MNWLEQWWYRRLDDEHKRMWGRKWPAIETPAPDPAKQAAAWLVFRIEVGKEGIV